MEWAEFSINLYASIPAHADAFRLILFGPYWWVFWFIQIGIGTLVPVAIVLSPRLGLSVRWLGLAGFLVAAGILGTRLNIVIPPQIAPVFDTLPDAYQHFRFSVGYVPSVTEYSVVIGVFAFGAWLLFGGLKVLPLELEAEGRPGT